MKKRCLPYMALWLVFIAIMLAFSGCTRHKTADMLNSRLNAMTFEEAIQRFGPPSNCAEAGATKVCTWVYGSGGAMYATVGQMTIGFPPDVPTARLTFTNGILTYWYLTGNWQ